jgi:hypothetical protein
MLQRIFGFIDRLSLAQKGRILFVGPVIAQFILLFGLLLIQVETADFYPRRSVQDREISDSITYLMLHNYFALKGLRQARKEGKPPDEECTVEYQNMLAEEAKLEEYWNDFYTQRKKIEITLDHSKEL